MATYKVIAPGFYDGLVYSPTGKRQVLTTEKPFAKDKQPSWLEPIKVSDEKVVKKTKDSKSNGPLSDEDDKDTNVTFIADNEQTPTVETL